MRTARIAAALAVLPVLGCARQLQVSFVNDSGQPISVEISSRGPATSGEFKAGRIARPPLQFSLTFGQCSYLYELPGMVVADGGTTTLQIETDYSIYASPARTALAVADLTNKQPSGFPLQPLASTCPAD